ncbi:MAG TPA: TonB-dependent receptor [Gemmatimonadaceae bacterium]|nr:TonB-dependent receptor [Gemmatimonadaceae bacterium]
MASARRISVVAAACLVLAHRTEAQEVAPDTARIAPVVVTATRSPIPAGRTPAAVTVLDGEQLRAEGITTVADALRAVPGLSVVPSGSYGGATSLFIRGGESKYAKILVDGVPLNDAGGAFDLSTLSTDNLDRIEVVRGPASVLYGSDAMAGVVQLFTRRGAGVLRGDVSARAGGFGSRDVDASVRGGGDRASYSVGAARHTTDGFQAFNSGFRQSVASALVGTRVGELDASLSARFADRVLHYPTNGSGEVVDSNAVRRDGRLALGLDAGYRLSPLVTVRAALASHDVHGVSENQPDSPADDGYAFSTSDRSRRRSGDLRVEVVLPADSRLTVGAQVERQWQETATTSNFGDDLPAPSSRRSTGGYAQLLLSPIEDATVALGGRFEHNEQFGDFWTYRAAASTRLPTATRLRASVGTAFREPTFLETEGSGFVIGNRALNPEHALSVDAGVEQTLGPATVGATWFANSFRDMIDYKYSATEPNYFNLARTRASGVELEGRLALPQGVHADVAFTHLSARVVDPGTSTAATATFAPGSRLLRRPARTLDVGAGYRRGGHGVELRALRVGSREDVYYPPEFAPAQRVALAAYTRVDVSGEARLVPLRSPGGVVATLRIENLLDRRYTDAAGYNYDFTRTDDASLRRTGYRAAGRRLLAGLRVSF